MELTKQRAKIVDLQTQLAEHREYKQLLVQEKLLSQQLVGEKQRTTINWKKESSLVKTLSLSGKTNKEIGDVYGVSGERVRQVILQYFPALVEETHGLAVLREKKRQHQLASLYARTGRYTGQHESDLSRAISRMFSRKKQNAKKGKWEWLITPSDLDYPLVCPMLGIELDWFAESREENSPSIDRINSTKGYIPGNVLVCSWRANRIKNDGTPSELRKIADFLARHHTTTIDTQ